MSFSDNKMSESLYRTQYNISYVTLQFCGPDCVIVSLDFFLICFINKCRGNCTRTKQNVASNVLCIYFFIINQVQFIDPVLDL